MAITARQSSGSHSAPFTQKERAAEKAFACVCPARACPKRGARQPAPYQPHPPGRNEQSTAQMARLRREMEAGVAPGPHKSLDALKTILARHGVEPSDVLVQTLQVWKGT